MKRYCLQPNRRGRGRRRLLESAVCCLLPAVSLFGQQYGIPAPLKGVGIDQNLNAQAPLDTTFFDESGQTVRLGQYFGRKPVMLALVYYQCPMLCNLVLTAMVKGMKVMSLDAGKDYEVVTVSIDPRETPSMAAAKKSSYVEKYGRAGAAQGWHFLTGREPDIQRLTQAAGFRYVFDKGTNQYAHAAGIMLLTPEGRFSRYFYGLTYRGRDLRLGLVEASGNKIGSPVDQLMLYCFHYDPANGRYGLVIVNILRVLGMGTLLALALFIVTSLRRERRTRLAGKGWRTA